MDNKLLEQLKNAPKEIKDFVLTMLLSGGMAMKEVENSMKVQNNSNIQIEQSQDSLGTLSEAFLAGKQNKQTKEYAEKFYKILGAADKIAKEKYGQTYFSNNEGYDEIKQVLGNGIDKVNTQKQYLNEQTINNKLEYTVSNTKTLLNHDYIQANSKPIYSYSIKIKNKYNIDILEQYLKVIRVYDKNSRDKKLEMYLYPDNLSQFNEFLKLFRQNQDELTSIYSIEYYTNYKKYFMSIDSFAGADIVGDKLVLSFNGKIV